MSRLTQVSTFFFKYLFEMTMHAWQPSEFGVPHILARFHATDWMKTKKTVSFWSKLSSCGTHWAVANIRFLVVNTERGTSSCRIGFQTITLLFKDDTCGLNRRNLECVFLMTEMDSFIEGVLDNFSLIPQFLFSKKFGFLYNKKCIPM